MPRWLAPIGLLLMLLTAACANNGEAPDSDRHNGFYGGISGDGAWP
jgi:hypothetical protein